MSPDVRTAISSMARSGIRHVMDLAWATPDVVHLEVGEPDFATPLHICEAAASAIMAGHTRYTPNAGILPLREAIAEKVTKRNGFVTDPSQVVVSAGAVEAIYASLLSIMDPGDDILLPDPGWPNFRMMASLLSANVIYYPLRAANGFMPDPEEIRSLVTPRTRAILINSPSNPLGTVIAGNVLEAIYAVACQHDLVIVSDECYDEITFDQPMFSPARLDVDERVISTYSFSKTYAMTGWRVGYAIAPVKIAAELSKVQEPLVSCVSGPAQYAALAALEGGQQCVEDMRATYQERRDFALRIAAEFGINCIRPEGAFYLWVDIRDSTTPSLEFALALINNHRVALAPGSAFGEQGEGWVRVSLANSTEAIETGLNAIYRQLSHSPS